MCPALLSLSFLALFLVQAVFLPASLAAADSSDSVWILQRFDSRSKGLPGLPRNAFEALAGSYRKEPAEHPAESVLIHVWASRESLWFSSELWEAGPVFDFRSRRLGSTRQKLLEGGDLPSFASGHGEGSWRIIALQTPYTMEGEGAGPADWALFFAFPKALSQEAQREFALLFLERFATFLERARSPQEVSLPALIKGLGR